ncbi:hypothetical protein CR532_04870 (plasmid) [Candidatus Borreliella tachyglossi]|uniref:Tyr recombinase domain-containing protein n=1 Tax=Candidatus Borreliella tachyglossi TaxID=1964448 RepID=A0A2S1LYE5_9SPIR|nr:site-specific integrase [Candidatus Borreliella tachyglossi]AWG43334.1 hypothetical protein CR532_04870 [Candidatus Borreliella tachyglossi]
MTYKKNTIKSQLNERIVDTDSKVNRASRKLVKSSKKRTLKKNTTNQGKGFNLIDTKLLFKYIENVSLNDGICGAFLRVLYLTGARGVELQNARLCDLHKNPTGDGYILNLRVAKKRNSEVIRSVFISKDTYTIIQDAHRKYFSHKKNYGIEFTYKRTFLFQKTKHKKLCLWGVTKRFRAQLIKSNKNKPYGKNLHILRHNYIKIMKLKGFTITQIACDLQLSDPSLIYKTYGELTTDIVAISNIMRSSINTS